MIAVSDTETTGFKFNHIVEMASVIYTDAGDRYEWYSRCKPSSPIEDGAAQVHGITNAMVANERSDVEVIAEWWSDIQSLLAPGERLVFAGHNTPFDLRALRKYVEIPLDTPSLCSMKLGRLYNPEAPNHKLTTLHGFLKLPGEYKAHSAFDDVLMSLDIIQHYMTKTGKGYLDLAQTQSAPTILKTMPFGKFKGDSFSTIDANYIKYMMGFSDLDPDVLHTFKHELSRRGL